MTNRWWQTAIVYQVVIRSFKDSNGDGIGDFDGLTETIPYVKSTEVDCLWVTPFCPSPLRDDGYDVSDFYGVHPDLGDLDSVKRFIRALHAEGLRVIADVTPNHTSDQHPWFQESLHDPKGRYGDFYVWSDTDQKYQTYVDEQGRQRDVRVLFKDSESSNWEWSPERQQFYWHRFFHHQPDLNWANPAVEEEFRKIQHHWLKLGFDGLRWDAAAYLFEEDGHSCENHPRSHAALARLHRDANRRFRRPRVFMPEVNQQPRDQIAYFGTETDPEGDLNYHFPLMLAGWRAVQLGQAEPLYRAVRETSIDLRPGATWATFWRNHDELSFEMADEDESEELFDHYAPDPRARANVDQGVRRRMKPLLRGDHSAMRLLWAVQNSLPGAPFHIYGDEIGMGDNLALKDRDGCRLPMQWSGDRNGGFSTADPDRLYLPVSTDPVYGYAAVNVDQQARIGSSLWNSFVTLNGVRRRYPVLALGSYEPLDPHNPAPFVHVRQGSDTIVCAHNLAEGVEPVSLDLDRHGFGGWSVYDAIGGRELAPVETGRRYGFPLGGHAFLWLRLVPPT